MVQAEAVAVRLSPELVKRIDAIAADLSARAIGATLKRSDALRLAVERGVEVLERQLSKKPKR